MRYLVTKFNFILFLTLSVSLISGAVYAQKSLSDSLDRILKEPMADTSKVLLYDQIARTYMYSKPLLAMDYIKQAISLSVRIEYYKGEARTKNRLGSIYKNIGSYAKALEAHFDALNVSKTHEDIDNMARIFNNIGILYSTQKDYRRAVDYYNQAKPLAEQLGDSLLLEIIRQNLGTDYAFMGTLDSARYYTLMALQIAKQRKASTANTLLINLGNLEYRKKEYSTALDYYRMSLPVSEAAMDISNLSLTYFEMARVFWEVEQVDSSKYYAEKALALGKQIDNPSAILDASMLLSELYELTDKAKAHRYLKMAFEAKDQIFDEAKVKQINDLGVKEQIQEQQRQTEKILYENRIRTIALLVGIVVFMFIAFLLYRNNRIRQKAHGVLKVQKEKLESTLSELKTTQIQLIQAEKMASLGELTAGIAHEIQNPLNFVTNYSDVNVELLVEMKEELEKGNSEEVRELTNLLHENHKKIVHHGKQAGAIVRGMVEISKRANGQRESTDINALASEHLKVAYHSLQTKDSSTQIVLETRFDPDLPKLNVIPGDVGKVIHNLANNAIYAVLEKKRKSKDATYVPTVEVTTRKVKDRLEVSVKDNGTGMSEKVLDKIFQPFFTTKPTGQGTGLGLSLAFDIVTKGHGGKLDVKSKVGEGSEFTVQLPLNTQIAEPV